MPNTRPPYVPDLQSATKVAHDFLAEAEQVNIHDRGELIQAFSALRQSMRHLLAALAENGVPKT